MKGQEDADELTKKAIDSGANHVEVLKKGVLIIY